MTSKPESAPCSGRNLALMLAANGSDLLCFGLAAVGVERIKLWPGRTSDPGSYSWLHGMPMSAVWSAATAAGASRGLPRPTHRHRPRPRPGHAQPLLGARLRRVRRTFRCSSTDRDALGWAWSTPATGDGTIHCRRALTAELRVLAAGMAVDRTIRHQVRL